MPRRDTHSTTTVRKGTTASSTSASTGSTVNVMMMPPISNIGARTPSLCIMPIILCTLYVSDDSRDTSDGTVNPSVCAADRCSVRENRSFLRRSVVSRATLDAMRLAMTLPNSAINAKSSMAMPQITNLVTFFSGASSSII